MSTKTRLFQQGARGEIREWSIEYWDSTIYLQYGVMGGAMQNKSEHVPLGLGGRSTESQVKSRVQSRINKQLDRGYKVTVELARDNVGTNALNLYKPMLAQPLKKVNGIVYDGAYLQPKLDGHRCLITSINGELIAYSRVGKILTSIDHILDGINLSDGQVLDGELYCHGTPLQQITSWVKRKQEDTKRLCYYAYDMVDERPFAERFFALGRAVEDSAFALQTSTEAAQSAVFAKDFFTRAKRSGYEGAILRWGNAGYQTGKRSKYLVKIKGLIDGEFEVVDIIPSTDGWGILVCINEVGDEFKVNAPGSYDEKYSILHDKLKYIGRQVTVEYANLTMGGVPFHPVAIRFRRDV